MADNFLDMMMRGQLGGLNAQGGGNANQPAPNILAAITGLRSTTGFGRGGTQGLMGAKPDPFGLFRETRFSQIWQSGFPVADTGKIDAPDTWVGKVLSSSQSEGGIER